MKSLKNKVWKQFRTKAFLDINFNAKYPVKIKALENFSFTTNEEPMSRRTQLFWIQLINPVIEKIEEQNI